MLSAVPNNLSRQFLLAGTLLFASVCVASAENFIMPISGRVYIKLLAGDGGAATNFGVGSSPTAFTSYLQGIPDTPSQEVLIGTFPEGATVPFGMHTTFAGQSAWAFVSGTDQPSLRAFTDTDNSLGMGGRIFQQTSPTTWKMNLDNAMSYLYDDDDNDLLIQIRLEAVPTTCSVVLGKTATSAEWSGTGGTVAVFADTTCPWTATSEVAWIQPYPLSAVGTSELQLRIQPNFSSGNRGGVLKVNGQNFTVMQPSSGLTLRQRFVHLLYFSFLGRVASAAEVAFQTSALDQGFQDGELIGNFFASEEFNLGGRFIAGLYVGILDRDAEYGGWLFQRNALATGSVSPGQLVTNFLGSAEWQLKFGSPTDADFVRLLYRKILLREPSVGEVAFQSNALAAGTLSRTAMAQAFLNSAEFRVGTGSRLIAFLLYSTLLQRAPTAQELIALGGGLRNGISIRTYIDQLIGSTEFLTVLQ
jgi:hypothetical protein